MGKNREKKVKWEENEEKGRKTGKRERIRAGMREKGGNGEKGKKNGDNGQG